MLQSCASVFAFSLGFVAVVPAFAAIVPIAISQQVSASGGVGCLAPDRPCTPPGAEFSFSASNTQPGPYSVNKTGQAAVSAGLFFQQAALRRRTGAADFRRNGKLHVAGHVYGKRNLW